jgi:hypothetical protein
MKIPPVVVFGMTWLLGMLVATMWMTRYSSGALIHSWIT